MAAVESLASDPYFGFSRWLPCIDAININNGDLCWWDAANQTVKAASGFTYVTSDALTRRLFKRVFLGIMVGKKVSGDGALQVQIINGLAKTTIESGAVTWPGAAADLAPANLVGISSVAGAVQSQQCKVINNPDEAIGNVLRKVSTTTELKNDVYFFSELLNPRTPQDHTIFLPAVIVTTTGAKLVIDPYKLFGGAAEVLAFGFNANKTALTVQSLIANLDNGGTNLAALTVTTGVGLLYSFAEADMSADAARVFVPGTNLTIEVSQECTAGEGSFYIRYRKLS